MSDLYLLLKAAGTELLLAMDHVVEVADAGNAADDRDGCRFWRGQALPVRNLCRQLAADPARAAAPRHQVVARGSNGQELVEVEEVVGLVTVEPTRLVPFAPTTPATARHFDLALRRPDGGYALRLRWPLPAPGQTA